MRISDWSSRVLFRSFLRLAYSKAITRPDYGNLSPALLLNPISMTASGGNPALVPTKADQYDASLEYYFGKSNYVAVALFRKDVSGFIQKFYADETIKSEEHTSELQSLMRTSYAVFCLKKK